MPPRGLHLRPRRRLALVHQRRRLQLHPTLRSTPTPLIVTTDGQKGALKAITTTWLTTKIQRCLVHVKRNVQKHVTLRSVLSSPKSTPGSLLETAESHHTRTSRRLAQTPPRVLPHLRGLA
ncbi:MULTISPECIES: transposase [Corynebacterium]|uniref:transposase n=1 Tax=Corynebacterium TaxID=1716 RepID=UPI0011861E7F